MLGVTERQRGEVEKLPGQGGTGASCSQREPGGNDGIVETNRQCAGGSTVNGRRHSGAGSLRSVSQCSVPSMIWSPSTV